MNINYLRDSDAGSGAAFYVAACGTSKKWEGAVVYESVDSGHTYQKVSTLVSPTPIGVTTTVLPDFSGGNIPDELSSVRVRLRYGTLSSVSYTLFLEGVSVCVIGGEIMLFRNATLNTDGSYTLSGFLRGRRGTEHAMGTHAVGDRFVLLQSSVRLIDASTADIGKTKLYKAVTSGSTLAATTPQSFKNEGAGLRPYAPCQLGGGRHANGDLQINWTRRSRLVGEWRDYVDTPLSEAVEQYDVEIWDAPRTTLKRTISGITSQTTLYTAAQQTADFGSPQESVNFTVYQISAIVGRGYPARGSA
jgi:hypothetical protein